MIRYFTYKISLLFHQLPDGSPLSNFMFNFLLGRIQDSVKHLWLTEIAIGAVVQRCSVNKVFLEISQNSQENTCARVSFLIKLQAWGRQLIKKGTLAQVFSCEFCKVSKNTFLHRTPLVAASVATSASSQVSYL